MYSIHHLFRKVLVSACPLCGLIACAGELCEGCAQDVLRNDRHGSWCLQCAIRVECGVRRCVHCMHANPAFTQTITMMDYAYPGAILVRGLKEHGRLAHARLFARMLANTWGEQRQASPPIYALVPVPSSQASLIRRGFNPAAEIARALSAQMSVPLRHWLIRTREGGRQKALDYGERRQSVRGLYACPETVPPVWVGVVDDVLTSGSTMHESAMALKHAGALGVVAFVAARTAWAPAARSEMEI